ncbi:MAG: pantoate--beta-alanine ligase [Sphingomonadales bacterium]|nr:pantoate--beta-alanine ligase [Sphingomonadales bacterium]PIX66868.1 MAG: pantoate--beta-alanine ligase [Sphingomonadales bacterium CG_4_10_14_3_um_filter_58_15]NCO48230.1 pantoate--beta-alanine ligase [Sphingomonadales bacterium]NCO99741.1 pantoate--beta-alanine ligase [Sphingomonadales bacterium]NCP27424.1 pantoate--beta-alanine ligase [Sphingomonadales bacterium]
MQIVRQLDPLRDALAEFRKAGLKIGLVPTMGALHSGHMRLVEVAREECDAVVASIFVNPTQFGEGEDLDAYPRQEVADAALLDAAGVELLWAPTADQMYPSGYATSVSVTGISDGLCGAARPGHFDGVATVVAKLFNQVRPDAAYFGEKDYQQLAVIRRMARDLDFAHEIVGVPTVRDPDGLALSSRNAYLTAEQRANAVALPEAMREAATAIADGGKVAAILEAAKAQILDSGFHKIDYLELRDAHTLALLDVFTKPARLFAAAHIGRTRLIDNIPLS